MAARAVPRLMGAMLALVTVAGSAGCSVSVGSIDHRTTSFSARGIRAVVVNGQVGSVRITGSDSSLVRVTEHISFEHSAPGATHRAVDGTLTLNADCPALETCGVSYVITAPAAISVRVIDGTGHVWLGSLSGNVMAHTDVGDIDVQALSGSVDASTNAGSISGQDLSGAKAVLQVTAGQINASFIAAPASVTASATVGSVVLRVPAASSYAVDANTTVGSVKVDVINNPHSPHAIKVTATTGSISISPAS